MDVTYRLDIFRRDTGKSQQRKVQQLQAFEPELFFDFNSSGAIDVSKAKKFHFQDDDHIPLRNFGIADEMNVVMVPKSTPQSTLLIRLENMHDATFDGAEGSKCSIQLMGLAAHLWFSENEYLYDDAVSNLSLYDIANLDIRINEVYPSGTQKRHGEKYFKWRT